MFLITLWTCSPNSAQMYCHQLLWSARKPNFVTTTWAPVTVWFALASIPLTTGWRSLPISLPSQPTWCKLQDLGRPVPQCQSRPLSPLCLATFCFSMKFLSSRKQDGSWQPYPGHPETLCIEIWKPCSLRPGEERAQLSRRLRSSLAVASVLDMMLPDNVVPWREIPELPQMNAESTSINQPNQAEIPTPPVRHQRDLAVRPQSRQEQLRNAEESSRACRECARTISLTCPRGKKGVGMVGKKRFPRWGLPLHGTIAQETWRNYWNCAIYLHVSSHVRHHQHSPKLAMHGGHVAMEHQSPLRHRKNRISSMIHDDPRWSMIHELTPVRPAVRAVVRWQSRGSGCGLGFQDARAPAKTSGYIGYMVALSRFSPLVAVARHTSSYPIEKKSNGNNPCQHWFGHIWPKESCFWQRL